MGIFTREPELSGILSGFSKTADQLRNYSARQREKVSKLKAEIGDKEVELATSESNIAQAEASAAKLAEIIGSAAA